MKKASRLTIETAVLFSLFAMLLTGFIPPVHGDPGDEDLYVEPNHVGQPELLLPVGTECSREEPSAPMWERLASFFRALFPVS